MFVFVLFFFRCGGALFFLLIFVKIASGRFLLVIFLHTQHIHIVKFLMHISWCHEKRAQNYVAYFSLRIQQVVDMCNCKLNNFHNFSDSIVLKLQMFAKFCLQCPVGSSCHLNPTLKMKCEIMLRWIQSTENLHTDVFYEQWASSNQMRWFVIAILFVVHSFIGHLLQNARWHIHLYERRYRLLSEILVQMARRSERTDTRTHSYINGKVKSKNALGWLYLLSGKLLILDQMTALTRNRKICKNVYFITATSRRTKIAERSKKRKIQFSDFYMVVKY